MTEVRISGLSGAALDWAVAKAEGDEHWTSDRHPDWFAWRVRNWKPSTDWACGGPLIEKHKVGFIPRDADWMAMATGFRRYSKEFGETQLIAACRAIVSASQDCRDVVSVPSELAECPA